MIDETQAENKDYNEQIEKNPILTRENKAAPSHPSGDVNLGPFGLSPVTIAPG